MTTEEKNMPFDYKQWGISLLEIYNNDKESLPHASLKIFNKFINKIRNDAYLPDKKNIDKLQEFADDKNIVEFLVLHLHYYPLRPNIKNVSEHHDILRLRSSWTVLALSNQTLAIEYLKSLVQNCISEQNQLYLRLLYNILSEFVPQKFDLTIEKIKKYE